MDQNTLQLSDCTVRYQDDGSLEFNYQGQPQQGSEKKAGPSAINSQGVTWHVPVNEVEKLQSFITSRRSISSQS